MRSATRMFDFKMRRATRHPNKKCVLKGPFYFKMRTTRPKKNAVYYRVAVITVTAKFRRVIATLKKEKKVGNCFVMIIIAVYWQKKIIHNKENVKIKQSRPKN